jgi:hypothetical protein
MVRMPEHASAQRIEQLAIRPVQPGGEPLMRRIAATASVGLALALGALTARAEDPKPRGLAGAGLTQDKIEAAVARAIADLVEATEGAWPEDGNGFGHGTVHLWSEDGLLLATGSQSVIVRMPE